MQRLKPAKLVILLCLILLLGAVVPVHALTTCQQIQQTVNNYLTSTYYAPYCKYNSTTEGDKIKIYLDCDRRPWAGKTSTISLGNVYSTDTYTTTCYDQGNTTGYPATVTRTYYKYRQDIEYCDGHTSYTESSNILWWCITGACGSTGGCSYGSSPPPYVHPQNIDCNSLVSHIYQTSFTIPGNCDFNGTVPVSSFHNLGPACGNSIQVNSSSNLKSGNYYHTQSVISKPTSLPFELYYNSLETSDTPLGKGWSHTYSLSLVEGTTWISLKLGNGDSILFTADGSGSYQPDPKSGDSSVMSINSDGTYKRTLKDGTIQTFNVAGKLSLIKDLNGVITSLYYNGSDLSSMYKSAVGAYLTTTTTNGRITTIKDTAGRITTFGYTGNLLTSVTGPAGDTWQYVYDANGRMIQKTDPLGYQSSNSYDASGKLISSTDPEGKTKSVSYDPATNTSTITEKDGSIWHQQYDPAINAATVKNRSSG